MNFSGRIHIGELYLVEKDWQDTKKSNHNNHEKL